jgi:2-keto-4-pentenoate hydratase/2-oxohepta-3-ene-1,7-dioic acid hydratase in catechol pathway
MAVQVVRFHVKGTAAQAVPVWGVVFDRRIAPLNRAFATTGDFVREGLGLARSVTSAQASISLDAVTLLSPVTHNQQFICQGINYESHVRESGMDPAKIGFNTIFTKASSCITGPHDDVRRPRHVELLDYEIELGLVLKTDITSARAIGPGQLHEVLAGVTIVNDVSARDVQLPQAQFYKGKSYRTFGPVGPCLLLLDADEWPLWPSLRMKLSVNGGLRQNDLCGSMLHKPHQTLTELSGLHDLMAGDLIATGTPAGCAAKAPGKVAMLMAKLFLPDATKWKLFIKGGRRNPAYLQPNDVMELSIRTDDGRLDLGMQRSKVVQA